MTPEAQRIAIAEACGWRLEPAGTDSFGVFYASFWRHPEKAGIHELPDYLNDLNATHEAERVLDRKQPIPPDLMSQYDIYWGYLTHINEDIVHATAAQRAEAFLRTIGKWKEDA